MSDLAKNIDQAADLIRSAREMAVLTGAGVSAESGIPTFRGAGGLWKGFRIEEVASPFAFQQTPELVWEFYHMRRAIAEAAVPNPGHLAITALEERFGAQFTCITQNVDGLHRRAGTQRVLELHGALDRVRCSVCEEVSTVGYDPLPAMPTCMTCGRLLRPDIVWFGEMLPPDVWESAVAAIERADVVLVVGTSAVVFPAARLITYGKQPSRHRLRETAVVIELNVAETAASEQVDLVLPGKSGDLLPQIVERIGPNC